MNAVLSGFNVHSKKFLTHWNGIGKEMVCATHASSHQCTIKELVAEDESNGTWKVKLPKRCVDRGQDYYRDR